jgi:hypothetical protein
MGASFGLFVDSPDVFADDSKKKEIYAGKERYLEDQGCETLGRVLPELHV